MTIANKIRIKMVRQIWNKEIESLISKLSKPKSKKEQNLQLELKSLNQNTLETSIKEYFKKTKKVFQEAMNFWHVKFKHN